MRTIPEISKETVLIEKFLESKTHGDFVSYAEVESATGVTMNYKGRAFLRTAIKRRKLKGMAARGVGYEIIDEKTAFTAIIHGTRKIERAVKGLHSTTKHVIGNFYNKLTDYEQKKVVQIESGCAALKMAARAQRYTAISDITTVKQSNPVLPEG